MIKFGLIFSGRNALTENVIFNSLKIEILFENFSKTGFAESPESVRTLYSIREKYL